MANEVGIIRTYFKKNIGTGKIEVHHDYDVVQAPCTVNPNKCASVQIFPLTATPIYINGMLWTPALPVYMGTVYFPESEVITTFKITL